MTNKEFVQFLFDRPDDSKEWYFAEDFIPPQLDAQTQVAFAREVLTDAELHAEIFTERQFCLGYNYLINPACSAHCYSYLDTSINESERISVVVSMYNVFSLVFDRKCVGAASDRTDLTAATYEYLCYMWWDVFPRHGIPANSSLAGTDRTILTTLEKMLLLHSLACIESALHGLGHWHAARPDFVERTIDCKLSQIPGPLRKYAKSARAGSVQ
jgi:hypothetical protein